MGIFFVGMLLITLMDASANLLRDVPVGECHGCEVTCFEDCSLKYNREILQDDDFLQVKVQDKNQSVNNRTLTNIGKEYVKCLKDEKCPCPKEEAKASKNGTTMLLEKNATCVVLAPKSAAACAQDCGQKVVSRRHAILDKKKQKSTNKTMKKQVFLEKHYPIHSVTVGVFSRGAMNMDQCLKFCMAATCGCDKAPGLDSIDKLFKAIKQNDAALPGEKDFSHRDEPATAVADTDGSYKFRPAKIEECAKGMIGKKVSKGLYIDMGGGVGGELEICSAKLMERIFGPGDHKEKFKLCKSTKSDDSKWGCVWNAKKNFCGVGFSPNLHCLKKYINDPTQGR